MPFAASKIPALTLRLARMLMKYPTVLLSACDPNVDVTHLGDLAEIGLYADDKQISRISDQELSAAQVSYHGRVSTLR